eukprot:jgi/Ulvmu1/5253/UM022_0046.1
MFVLLLSAPVLHLATAFTARSFLGEATVRRAASVKDVISYLSCGGPRYHVFQLFATVLWFISVLCSIVFLVSGNDAWVGSVAGSVCGALPAIVIVFFIKAHILHLDMLHRLLSFRRYLVAAIAVLGTQLSSVASTLVLDVSRRTHQSRIKFAGPARVMPFAQHPGPTSSVVGSIWTTHDAVVPYAQSERLVCFVQITLALACMVVASMSTYGVTGYVLHRFMPTAASIHTKPSRSSAGNWSFFQPFKVLTALTALRHLTCHQSSGLHTAHPKTATLNCSDQLRLQTLAPASAGIQTLTQYITVQPSCKGGSSVPCHSVPAARGTSARYETCNG